MRAVGSQFSENYTINWRDLVVCSLDLMLFWQLLVAADNWQILDHSICLNVILSCLILSVRILFNCGGLFYIKFVLKFDSDL